MCYVDLVTCIKSSCKLQNTSSTRENMGAALENLTEFVQVFITTCGQLLEPVWMLRKLLSPSNLSSQVPELESEILDELDRIMASLFSRYSDALDCDQFMLMYRRSQKLDCDQFMLMYHRSQNVYGTWLWSVLVSYPDPQRGVWVRDYNSSC